MKYILSTILIFYINYTNAFNFKELKTSKVECVQSKFIIDNYCEIFENTFELNFPIQSENNYRVLTDIPIYTNSNDLIHLNHEQISYLKNQSIDFLIIIDFDIKNNYFEKDKFNSYYTFTKINYQSILKLFIYDLKNNLVQFQHQIKFDHEVFEHKDYNTNDWKYSIKTEIHFINNYDYLNNIIKELINIKNEKLGIVEKKTTSEKKIDFKPEEFIKMN